MACLGWQILIAIKNSRDDGKEGFWLSRNFGECDDIEPEGLNQFLTLPSKAGCPPLKPGEDQGIFTLRCNAHSVTSTF